ncbi:MAG TPA: SIMPL domain-containing protein [Pseudomonadales bacterium]|nr:SIMPL domain-containing protein [Pseudomonadales bacterium]HND13584.1 SIMPL domain-containing protein [Pseudomonadales bacterium]
MKNLVGATLLAVAVAASGWFVGHGFERGHNPRHVTVKGVSERDVKADLALWPLRFVQAGDELGQVQAAIQKDDATVSAFLARHGIDDGQVAFRDLEVTDRAAQSWASDNYPSRYIISRTVMVRTDAVDTVYQATQATGELVDAGVVLDTQDNNKPAYLYNGLNELKPAMIAEATRNAREAADQFAHDSGARLGGIVTANQGVFQILARDKAPMLQEERQIAKTVRVVATIDYALED